MPGDYSRKTFDRRKHYRGVLMQQGRVQLDADWNEQLAIQLYRTETETRDVIGVCGVPKSADSFKISTNGGNLFIAPGRIYAGGLLCELETDTAATYTNQPYYPNPEFTSQTSVASPLTSPVASPPSGLQLKLDDGVYLVYLDAWQREINALDDPLIREKALGGPDTTARFQAVWQVRLLRILTNGGSVTCKTLLPEFDQRTAFGTGRLTARTKTVEDTKNPCLLPPKAGYLRLENQLYRVEVHKGGDRSIATFKWSRDNATVESTVQQVSGSVVTVSEIGKDEELAFRNGEWVELVTEEAALKNQPFPLVQIDQVDPATREITLATSIPLQANVPGLKLRRWDQSGPDANADGVPMALATFIDLEGGIQVRFSAGRYRSGDYWLIPARTATGEIEWPPYEIPNNNPRALLPAGIKHCFCRLALIQVQDSVIQIREDCRKPFPPLTEICAEDVCFDNGNCKLPAANTVQEALDWLCAERDLRFHNKHLHGWGIVCGLQVQCGPDSPPQPRRFVTVRQGYAIDCEGNDIVLDTDQRLNIPELAAALASPLASPLKSPPQLNDGELSLYIELDQQAEPRFRVEPFTPPKNIFQASLKNTLLADFIQDCILSLSDFYKKEFTAGPNEAGLPVGPARKRLTAILNLIIQLINPTNGSFVFLSREEDQILRDLYTRLRTLLQSKTFCAMFDGARPFPDRYPFPKQDIVTIFGKGSQQRLRIAPNGNVGYTVGGGTNKIGVYDLQKNAMAAEVEFPGGSNALVQDVAFSSDSRQLYVVGTINSKDSVFAVADVAGLNVVWRKPTVICDVEFVTLATAPQVSKDVYAIAKGKGLYQVNPQNVNATPSPMGNVSFNAVGHLVVFDQEGVAYATANAAGAASNTYNSVVPINLKSPTANPPVIVLPNVNNQPVTGQDDIALGFTPGLPVTLHVVVNPPSGFTTKQVMTFQAAGAKFLAQNDLGEGDTEIRLAFSSPAARMAVAYEESYRLALLDRSGQVEANFRFPVQISPLSIAVASNGERVYVLNFASNTITSIDARLLNPGQQLPLKDLVDYRTAVLNAFFDLTGGLLQYLKDCLCDHFLVNCPTCDADDKIYLAVISIKNGQIYKVCNFSLRKYVKSFPTIGYWLSLVPILPLLKTAVERFCCAALPGFFGRKNAPSAAVQPNQIALADNRIKSKNIRTGVEFVKAADFRSAAREQTAKIRSAGPLLFDALTKETRRPELARPSVQHSDIAGRPIDEVRRKLEAAKINVAKVEPYDPDSGLENVREFSRAPARLQEGANVTLVTRGDKVLYYKRETESSQIKTLREDLEATKTAVADANQLRTDMKALKDEIAAMQKRHEEALTSRDEELQRSAEAIRELRDQVARLAPQRGGTPGGKKSPGEK